MELDILLDHGNSHGRDPVGLGSLIEERRRKDHSGDLQRRPSVERTIDQRMTDSAEKGRKGQGTGTSCIVLRRVISSWTGFARLAQIGHPRPTKMSGPLHFTIQLLHQLRRYLICTPSPTSCCGAGQRQPMQCCSSHALQQWRRRRAC